MPMQIPPNPAPMMATVVLSVSFEVIAARA
jgi:hypothetical protein